MTPIWGQKASVIKFVSEIAGLRPDFGNCQTMAVIDSGGRMVAGIVFHNWEPDAGVIQVSAASTDRRWATRGVLREAFGYVFGVAGCQMAVARTAEENSAVRRLWRAFGAQEYIIPRLRGRAASEALITLTDDAWKASRFMRPKNGQE